MSASFTPGPWIAKGNAVNKPQPGSVDLQVARVACVAGDTRNPEAVANARLIAAAPDLYAALVSARNQLATAVIAHSGGLLDDSNAGEHAGIAEIDAALAKASAA